MVMRFHWGLAVGHTYTHNDTHLNDDSVHVVEDHIDRVEENAPELETGGPDSREENNRPDEERVYSLEDLDRPDWEDDADSHGSDLGDNDGVFEEVERRATFFSES
jgi:hypothetical protein